MQGRTAPSAGCVIFPWSSQGACQCQESTQESISELIRASNQCWRLGASGRANVPISRLQCLCCNHIRCLPTIRDQISVSAQDAAWEASHKQLAEVNGQLAKACIQNPLEYRTTALAAVQFAARPHDLDIDNQQAVHFCTQMMG